MSVISVTKPSLSLGKRAIIVFTFIGVSPLANKYFSSSDIETFPSKFVS